MTIGSVLLNPTKPQRAAKAAPDDLMLADIIDIIVKLLADAAHNQTLIGILKNVLLLLPDRIKANAGGGLDNAKRRILGLFAPLQAKIQTIADGFSSSNPADVLKALQTVLDLITDTLGDLDIAKARAIGEHATQIVKVDLGLNPAFLENLIFFFIDQVVEGMQSAALAAEPEDKNTLIEMALLLRRLKRTLRGIIVFPDFDPEKIAQAILDTIAQPEFQTAVKKAACIFKAISTALETGADLLDIVPFSGLGSRSVGAGEAGSASADDQYLWYASWLLGGKDRPAGVTIFKIFVKIFQLPMPGDDYVVEGGTNRTVRRNFLRADYPIAQDPLQFEHIPVGGTDGPEITVDQRTGEQTHRQYRNYTFNVFKQETMEAVARHTTWVTNAIEFLMHAFSIEKGDFVSNVGHMSYNTLEGLFRAFAKRPLPPKAVVPVRFGTYFLSSFEGVHSKAAPKAWLGHWVTLLGTDAVEANIYNSLGNSLRDALLSSMTLLNYKGDVGVPSGEDTRPNNRQEIDGLVGALVGLATSQVLVRLVSREDYVLIFKDVKTTAGIWLGGGIATGVLAGTVASVGAECLARAVDPYAWLNQLWQAPVQVLLSYWITLYTSKENDTDKGKYNPTGAPFDGYPDPATSPYKLPWEKDKTYHCIQGNQGIWSHNNKAFENGTGTSMVYAYDFALDQGDPLLASRGGVVVDFFDWCEDDKNKSTDAPLGATIPGQSTNDAWNFICIGHDVAAGDHDKKDGGAATTTYAIYGHGRNGSVRRSFAARLGKTEATITSADIIGTKVVQGQQIMETGNTGNSLHNHVHMEVRGGGPVPAPMLPISTYPAVSRGSLSKASLPFVFADEGIMSGWPMKPKGIPQSLDWPTSSNVLVTP